VHIESLSCKRFEFLIQLHWIRYNVKEQSWSETAFVVKSDPCRPWRNGSLVSQTAIQTVLYALLLAANSVRAKARFSKEMGLVLSGYRSVKAVTFTSPDSISREIAAADVDIWLSRNTLRL
jgi:hypothetical protein